MRDVASIQHASCVGLLRALAEHAPNGTTWERHGLRVAVTGAPIPLFNAIVALDDAVPDRAVEAVLDDVSQPGLSPSCWVRRGIDVEMAAVASRRGFTVVDEAPGMIARVEHVATAPTDPQIDLAVHDAGGSDVHLDLMSRSFGIPRPPLETFVTSDLLDAPDVVVAVGSLAGVPVTTALGVMTGTTVCLFDVATPPEHRGHGFGAAVTAFVVAEAAQRGARYAALQSTEAGFGVYRRIGFETVVDYDVWAG
jgi:ribosomal protein S18 acetylase RimI-like enzyme